ncbi:MAG: orotidine-5'-phosphate decarboxylase [Candidatus Firestonebacteria bacterium]
MKSKLIVALDVDSAKQAIAIVKKLKNYVQIFKVGLQLFTAEGPKIINAIKKLGVEVFLDAKFHDIPNTVAKACESVVRLQIAMLNVHTLGGYEMMLVAKESVERTASKLKIKKPVLLGVTILTSINSDILKNEIGVKINLKAKVKQLALLAKKAGLDGIVASPQEITDIRKVCGKKFIIVTPGVRPAWAGLDDQKRIMTPWEAINAGANYIVVGRPILKAQNPVIAVQQILGEI